MLLSGKSLKHDFIRFVSATMASQVVFSLYSMVDGLMVSIGVNEYAAALRAGSFGIGQINA